MAQVAAETASGREDARNAMISLRTTLGLCVAAACLWAAAPASAHHSFAMFDAQKTQTLEGTVKDFQWTNPHSWIQLSVKDATGKDVEWSIEAGSPNTLSRSGWRHGSLKPGDRAVLVIHPMKDGSPGGSLVKASANGVPIAAS